MGNLEFHSKLNNNSINIQFGKFYVFFNLQVLFLVPFLSIPPSIRYLLVSDLVAISFIPLAFEESQGLCSKSAYLLHSAPKCKGSDAGKSDTPKRNKL